MKTFSRSGELKLMIMNWREQIQIKAGVEENIWILTLAVLYTFFPVIRPANVSLHGSLAVKI